MVAQENRRVGKLQLDLKGSDGVGVLGRSRVVWVSCAGQEEERIASGGTQRGHHPKAHFYILAAEQAGRMKKHQVAFEQPKLRGQTSNRAGK